MRLVVVAVDYVVFCFCFMKIKCVYGEEKKRNMEKTPEIHSSVSISKW